MLTFYRLPQYPLLRKPLLKEPKTTVNSTIFRHLGLDNPLII